MLEYPIPKAGQTTADTSMWGGGAPQRSWNSTVYGADTNNKSRKLSPSELWRIRQALGFSRSGLASALNVTPVSVIEDWERGSRPPTLRQSRMLIRLVRRHAHRSNYLRKILQRFRPHRDFYSA